MPAATPIDINTITRAGTPEATPAACDATNGNTVANSGAVWLELQNTGGSSATVDLSFANDVDGVEVTKTLTLAASAHGNYGPWPVSLYGSSLAFKASAVSVKVAAWQLGS